MRRLKEESGLVFSYTPLNNVYSLCDLVEVEVVDKRALRELLKELEDDPEKYHSPFVKKWMNDDAMMCLSAFIREILGIDGDKR